MAAEVVAAAVVVDKMDCKCDFDEANFGSQIFCKKCGMDIELNTFKFHNQNKTELYCCEEGI